MKLIESIATQEGNNSIYSFLSLHSAQSHVLQAIKVKLLTVLRNESHGYRSHTYETFFSRCLLKYMRLCDEWISEFCLNSIFVMIDIFMLADKKYTYDNLSVNLWFKQQE